MIVVFLRTIILFLLVIISMRLMGKRQIGQLQPFELAVAIMISELAAIPMQNTGIPLINGVIPIITLVVLQIGLSILSLKSTSLRKIIDGMPTILVENGKIQEKNLDRELYTINDLMEQLRAKNIPNISDVEFAILETSGELSVIPKSQKRPITPSDIEVSTKYEGLPLELIVDGQINTNVLENAGLNKGWLNDELKKLGISNSGEILFASLDTQGKLYYQKKKDVFHS